MADVELQPVESAETTDQSSHADSVVPSLEERVTELERVVAELTAAQDSDRQLDSPDQISEQFSDMKSEMVTLQRGIWELTKLVSNKAAQR